MLWSQIISLVSTAKVHHVNFVKYTMYQYIYIPMYFWNKLLTYLLTHDLWPWMIFEGQIEVIEFLRHYRLNRACDDQSLHETHIVSHIWYFIWPHDLSPWMTCKGQIEVIGCFMGCISWILHVVIWICVNNEQIWLPGNFGSDFEQYLNRLQLDNFSFGQLFRWIGTYKTTYGLKKWFWAIFEPTSTLPNFTFSQLLTLTGTYNDHIWLPMG